MFIAFTGHVIASLWLAKAAALVLNLILAVATLAATFADPALYLWCEKIANTTLKLVGLAICSCRRKRCIGGIAYAVHRAPSITVTFPEQIAS